MKSETCPICNQSAAADARAHAELALEQAPRRYEVLRCAGCGLRWMSPYPTAEDFQTIYDHDYYESGLEGGFSYREEKRELLPCYAGVARRFRDMGVVERLLDVGCGTGDFLEAARDQGLLGAGVEPSEYAAGKARAKGFSVYQGVLSDLLPVNEGYAAAHCSHVLEHVPDAGLFMDELRSVLLPGAPLYLEVPLQFEGILDTVRRLRGQRREYSDYSIHHHYFFTPDALTRLLGAHGFEISSLTTFMPCRRAMREPGLRKWALQSVLWAADRAVRRGDVISIWARRGR